MPRSNPLTQSKPASLAPGAPDPQTSIQQFQEAVGRDGPIGTLPLLPQTNAYEGEVAKQKREAKTDAGDYLHAIVRQDSPVENAVAAWVGSEYVPDPKYNAYDPATHKAAVAGLPEEFHNELLKAVSGPHAVYIRSRIEQRLADEQNLGDMGALGQTGRFLAGLVEPTNLALGYASGGVTALVRGGLKTKVAAGLASGAAQGAAFEKLRQSLNFEDSNREVVEAGLMGLAFSAPFVGLSAREMYRVRQAAAREHKLLTEMSPDARTAVVPYDPEADARFTGYSPDWENGPVKERKLDEPPPHPAGLLEDMRGRDTPPEAPRGDAPTQPPEGFGPGSVGGAQANPVPVDVSAFTKWRWDIFARLNKSENPLIAALGKVFVKDGITSSDVYAQGRAVSEDKKIMQRTIGGGFHYEAKLAFDDYVKKLGLGIIDRNRPSTVDGFYQDIGRYLRDPSAFANHAGQAEIARAANAYRKVMSTMLEKMKQTGVKGSETLAANPDYVNRLWKQSRIRELAAAHGPDEVNKLVAKSVKDRANIIKRFRDRNPSSALSDDAIVENAAAKFLNGVMRLEHSHLSNEMLLGATDAPTLRAELMKQNLSHSEADEVIDALFEHQAATSGDAGNPPPLKYRFNLDEATTHTTASGETIRLSDLFENDARLLVDRYMNSMAGHVAMARQGIRSRADFNARLREAEQDHERNATVRDAKRFGDEKKILQDVYDNIVGRPMSMQKFNTLDRVSNMVRAYARSVYLGQLGFTAMNEAFHAAGISTWRAAIQQMPALAEFVRAARAGHVPSDSFAADIRQMLGYFNEHVSGYLRQHEITDFTYDTGLKRSENAANALSHAVDNMSGNSFMTTLTRGMAAGQMIQKYANFAHGKMKLTAEWRKRIVGAGINEDDIDHVLSQLKAHAEMDGNRVKGIKWEEWSASDPHSYHDFITAVDRDVRQGVQDHDIGETWYEQHTPLGKFFLELRAFNMAGHTKQFLNGLHYRDRTSFQLFTSSIAVNGLAYVVQTSMNFGHDPKELDKRLTAERIAMAAYQRSGMLGMMPFFTSTLLPGFLSPPQGSGITANTDSRNVLIPPSMNLVMRGVNFLQNGNPKDGLGILPFSNTYGARNLIDMIGKAYPNTRPH